MAQRTLPLSELADIIRSKNAGPFRITFDILFSDPARYRLVRDSRALNRETVAKAYGSSPSEITSFYEVDMANAIKVTIGGKAIEVCCEECAQKLKEAHASATAARRA